LIDDSALMTNSTTIIVLLQEERLGEDADYLAKSQRFLLTVSPDLYAVCRLGAAERIPAWAFAGGFCSVTRTGDEFSILCSQEVVPEGVEAVKGLKSFKVEGKLPFTLVGVLSSLTSTLAQAGISIFAVSTYDTDYLFIKSTDMEKAVAALRKAGHDVLMG
jgi:hypothetical protein